MDYSKYKEHKAYTYVYEPLDYVHYIDKLKSLDSELGIDIETYTLRKWLGKGGSALDPHTGRISTLTIKARQLSKPIIFDIRLLELAEYDRRPMYELLNSKKLLAFRMQFELKFLKRHYGIIFPDVMCLNYLVKLIGNATGSKVAKARGRTLNDILRDLLDVQIVGKGTTQVTDWYPRPELDDEAGLDYWFNTKLVYAAEDTNYLHRIHDLLVPELTRPILNTDIIHDGVSNEYEAGLGMADVLELENQSVRVAAEIEYNGLPASKAMFEAIQKAIYDESEQTGELVTVGSRVCKAFGLETIPSLWNEEELPTKESLTILNNPVKVKKYINRLVGTKLDNSQANVLQRIVSLLQQIDIKGSMELISDTESELYSDLNLLETSAIVESSVVIQDFLRYKQLRKQFSINLGTYINPVTGNIHSGIDMLGAATGRSSSQKPNQQNVPSRTYVEVVMDMVNIYKSSSNLKALIPDWLPNPLKFEIK